MGAGIVLLLAAAAFAQTAGPTSIITGTVVDLSDDVVVNAPIQATNVATKARYEATSSDKGVYTIAQVPAGIYELSATVLGFNPFTQSNVTVVAGQTLRFN